MKKLLLPIGIALIVCLILLQKTDAYTASDFLEERKMVFNYLSESFANAPDGAQLTTLRANSLKQEPAFPGDERIMSTLKRQQWRSHNHRPFQD